MKKIHLWTGAFLIAAIHTAGCSGTGNKKNKTMEDEFSKGTYGFDAAFFDKHDIETIELRDTLTGAAVLVVPAYQGRVMTSTSGGDKGQSYGWINYRHIESGVISDQFNPFGGEERFWLGPEGGPFSIYFRKGDEQVFPNWKVPAAIDTEPFELVQKSQAAASFRKDFNLVNAAGTEMNIGVERKITLLDLDDAEKFLGTRPGGSLSLVGYETVNTLVNKGNNAWDRNSGFLSVWLLGMFNPSESGVVFIPFKPVADKIVTDDYFGKVPSDRLIMKDSLLFFRTDGKHRSKIGISPEGAKPVAGGYDPVNKSLTILMFTLPEENSPYVNSKWGEQDDPLQGDVVNSYNDGPVEDGSIMGPFYEIESSSPAALLAPGERITHTQRTFHITGDEQELNRITTKLFGITIGEIKSVF
jgi:hypothetical protein